MSDAKSERPRAAAVDSRPARGPGRWRRTAALLSRRRRGVLVTALAVAGLGALAPAASAEEPLAERFPGSPLTVFVGPLGQCESNYQATGDNYYPEGSELGDCGFFLAFPKTGSGQPSELKGKTFGFSGNSGPGLSSEYTSVSQSPVTGAGTTAEPYTETTVFSVSEEGSPSKVYALITEKTTYVNGAAQFTSTYTVKNVTEKPATKIYFRAIYAGDLYVNGNDFGTGVFLAGPPRFIGGENAASGVIGGFQEAPSPALPWDAFQEACWSDTAFEDEPEGRCAGAAATDNGIWNDVRTTDEEPHAFNDSFDLAPIDNGAGVEWDKLREEGLAPEAEQAFTIINRTGVPSGLQVSPATQTLTQGQTETINVTALNTAGEPYVGKNVLYTVAGANSQSGSVTLNASGQAQISYVGHNAGLDTIQMYVDLAGTSAQTPSDPASAATVTFTPLPQVPNSGYTVQGVKANADGTVTITFVPTQSGTGTLTVTVPTGTIARREAIAAKHAKKCKKGQSRIKHKCRPTTTVTGTVSAPGVAGTPLTLAVKPSGKVKAALKKGKTVHLLATLTYTSALGGAPTVNVYHVTVKGKHRHRHGRRR
jgi:hypothetical protein